MKIYKTEKNNAEKHIYQKINIFYILRNTVIRKTEFIMFRNENNQIYFSP